MSNIVKGTKVKGSWGANWGFSTGEVLAVYPKTETCDAYVTIHWNANGKIHGEYKETVDFDRIHPFGWTSLGMSVAEDE